MAEDYPRPNGVRAEPHSHVRNCRTWILFCVAKGQRVLSNAYRSIYVPVISLVALSICAIAGFTSILNRLFDFRMTARRAGQDPLAPSLEEVRLIGRATWWLLFFQIVTFAIGTLFLAITLLLTYGSKLR